MPAYAHSNALFVHHAPIQNLKVIVLIVEASW